MARPPSSVDKHGPGSNEPPEPLLPPKIEVKLTSDPSPSSLASVLSTAVAPVLAVGGAIGALLLSLGWSYAWHWFAAWRVPYAGLGLGPDLLLEYGRIVVLHYWWLALFWIAVMLGGAWAIMRLALSKGLITLLCLGAFLIPWFASHDLGQRVADAEVRRMQESRFYPLSVVTLRLNKDFDEVLSEGVRSSLTTGPNLCHRLLYRAPNGLWLLRLRNDGWDFETVFIPDDAIVHLRLREAQGERC